MIRVVICDDHAIVRKGLVQILTESGDIQVTAEAGNFGELRQRLKTAACDVLVIDIEMPGKNGIEAITLLKKEMPRMPSLVLSIYTEDQYAVRALRAGASGYLNKASAPEQLVQAVRTITSGKKYISPETSQALAQVVSGESQEADHAQLSEREFQVLRMIAAGRKLSEIADELALSPKTVSVYRARILDKLKLANNVEIAHYAARHGLVEHGPG
jgi:two-component system invasion response regulator UvrY